MSKELWMDAYEQLVGEYLEEGLSESEAEKLANREAYEKMCDDAADRAEWIIEGMKDYDAQRT